MSPQSLLELARERLVQGHGLRVEESRTVVRGWIGSEPVCELWMDGSSLVVRAKVWLIDHPRSGLHVTRLTSTDPAWHCIAVDSEWHVRGIAASIATEATKRADITDKLTRGLAGQARLIEVGQNEAAFWRALAHWAKETEFLEARSRIFAFRYGDYLERGVPPSPKYAAWAERTAKAARLAGFRPPSRTA